MNTERKIMQEKLTILLGSGKMVSIDFVKQDGTIRTINGRVGVAKYTRGTGRNPAARLDTPYITFWETPKPQDAQRNGQRRYRNVNLTSIMTIRADGAEWVVV